MVNVVENKYGDLSCKYLIFILQLLLEQTKIISDDNESIPNNDNTPNTIKDSNLKRKHTKKRT